MKAIVQEAHGALVLGTDMAGVVEAVGKNVTQFHPGDEVFGETIGGMQWINGGAFAEYVSVAEECLALKQPTSRSNKPRSFPPLDTLPC